MGTKGNGVGVNALKMNDILQHFKFKHEELYSAPLCKLYAFEAKRVLCNSPVPGGPGEDAGNNNYEDGDDF